MNPHPRIVVRLALDERNLSLLVHALFSAWMLAFLFEGQVFYALATDARHSPTLSVFAGTAAMAIGLWSGGIFIDTKAKAKKLYLYSYPFFIALSAVFFFTPSMLWSIAMIVGSLVAGHCVAAWGFYLRSGTPKSQRLRTVADLLILSNLLMIVLNVVAVDISARAGLALSMLMLVGAFLLALGLPEDSDGSTSVFSAKPGESPSIASLLLFLCLFIVIITINSGLMYQVINPAFKHLEWLTSWYWALPYIAALFVMRNLPRKAGRAYMLYVAIAMMGLAFIAFWCLGRQLISYLVVNTLMLGACGVYDLFWWSILAEMLEFHQNPARILGIGLSANVLGVLLGGVIGGTIMTTQADSPGPTLLALTVVCITLALLPPLHKHLSSLLKGHGYLSMFVEMSQQERIHEIHRFSVLRGLSEREKQVAALLLQGKTYRRIGVDLYISENTVKYYVRNIYSKLGIQSRAQLIDLVWEGKDAGQ